MKKKICLVLSSIMAVSGINLSVAAYEPPAKIWDSFNKYANAIETSDYENIIKYGSIDLSILLDEPVNETTQSWICARYQKIAEAYEALGDHENSAVMYEKQIPYAHALGWYDSEKIAKAKSMHYKNYIDVYEKTNDTQCFFGARNELEKGILYGFSADSSTDQSQCSMKMIYLEYGDTNFDWIRSELKTADERNMAVEFAFNMPQQSNNLKMVINDSSYIDNLADFLARYPNIKYYFRFGAEFDLWEPEPNPEEYKRAFRKTADIIHARVKNAAMVFSPNMVSRWSIDIMDYYPGDEYVDWIGSSLYLMKYYLGVKDRPLKDRYLEAVFCTGDCAEPVLMMKKFVDLFGDRKPIMISESGASHYVNTVGEDTTDWALKRLDMLYGFLPVVYPQIKLIAHFDTEIANEVNNYALKSNSRIASRYNKLVSDGAFIKVNYNNNVDFAYKKLGDVIYYDGSAKDIATYAHVYGKPDLKINYYIDGNWVASSKEIPYKTKLDTSKLNGGKHTLKVSVEADGKEVNKREYKLISSKESDKDTGDQIKVMLNGKKLAFDYPPVIVEGRTLVPLRAIFEAMGATVDWDNKTKTAIANDGKTEVKISIGSKILYKNSNAVTLDVEARLINEKTMVPARAIAEAFGAKVGWEQATKTVIIDY